MIISEVMTREVRVASPDDTLQCVARVMEEEDFGSLPPQESKVRDVMSTEVRYVYDHESVRDVAQVMGDLHVRRLAILNRNKRLVRSVLSQAPQATAGPAGQRVIQRRSP